MSTKATQTIKNLTKELEAITSVVEVENPSFDRSKPASADNPETIEVVGQFSCERIERLIEAQVKEVTAIINSKTQSISEIMSTWAPILDVPGNPMKIIKWAIKVATGPASQQVEIAIKKMREIVELISALAELAAAVAGAAATLASCLETAVTDAIYSIIDSVLENAEKLMTKAESIVDGIISDILEDTGLQDIIDQFDESSGDLAGILGEGEGALDDFLFAGRKIKEANGTLKNMSINIPGI